MEPKDLILIIAQALVDNPEQVSVNEDRKQQHRHHRTHSRKD